jgi:hypothetical protein
MTKETKNRIKKIVNMTRAIPMAAPATPLKPRSPAISATIKNINVHPNIVILSLFSILLSSNRASPLAGYAVVPELNGESKKGNELCFMQFARKAAAGL